MVQPFPEAQMFRHRSGCSKWREAIPTSQGRSGSEASCRDAIPVSLEGPGKTWKRQYLYCQFFQEKPFKCAAEICPFRDAIPVPLEGPGKTWKRQYLYRQFFQEKPFKCAAEICPLSRSSRGHPFLHCRQVSRTDQDPLCSKQGESEQEACSGEYPDNLHVTIRLLAVHKEKSKLRALV